MNRSERHDHFERILALRDAYRASSVDHHGVLSVDDAILYAGAVLTAVESDLEPWLAELERALDGSSDTLDHADGDHPASSMPAPPPTGRPSRRRLLGDTDRD